ncbi:MAG: GTP 3',8-cyclase MoaA [bacterium]|nr:GTP 3',8-cyclase MoaA [bacterium]
MRLIDRFQRRHTYLRISLTDRCNLRCSYCMPHERPSWMAHGQHLQKEELLTLIRLFVSLGIEKIRFTGGEPLLIPALPELIAHAHSLPGVKRVALTTNGTKLTHMASSLRDAGLNAINVSLDSLHADRFLRITARDEFNSVWLGVQRALEVGFDAVKINVVVMKGVNDDELSSFVSLTKHHNLTVRFIEYMPFPGTEWDQDKSISAASMIDRISRDHALEPIAKAHLSDTADLFRIPGHQGLIGFISPMSHSFCAACDRLRLTADGAIKACLFHAHEVSLRDLMRSGASERDLLDAIQSALGQKMEAHGVVDDTMDNRTMLRIGG